VQVREIIYLETANKEAGMKKQGGRRLNVSGVLGQPGISKSGYYNWKNRICQDWFFL